MAVRPDVVSPPDIQPDEFERYRRELTAHCYRMLGSGFEAEDAVQETMMRAWKATDSFEGRSAVRSWLYRIATNVCLDMLRGRQRRARPMEVGPVRTADTPIGGTLPEHAWISPIADDRVVPDHGDPADVAEARDTIRLAFIAALQHLPPRQRAVLILREVLRWQAIEVAELLDTSVPSVNSALQRARATLSGLDLVDVELQSSAPTEALSMDAEHRALLARYVDAFERYDIESLVSLLRTDAVMTMPPFDFWLRGSGELGRFFLGQGVGCRGSRLIPAGTANGWPAFGSYKIDPAGGYRPWSLQLIEISGDRIVGHHNFLDTNLFTAFGLPDHLDP